MPLLLFLKWIQSKTQEVFLTSAHKRSFKVVFTEAKWTWRCHRNQMQDTVSLTMGNFGTEPTINYWKPITGLWITLQNTSPFIHSIHHCHIDHNAPCLPPPPPPNVTQLLSSILFGMTVIPKRNWKQWLCNFSLEGGGVVNKVQEPAIQSCDTGQQIAFFDSCQLTIIWISTITFCVYKHKLYLPWTRTEASKSRSL